MNMVGRKLGVGLSALLLAALMPRSGRRAALRLNLITDNNVLRIYLKAISGFYFKSRFLSTVVYVIMNSSRSLLPRLTASCR